MIHSMCGASESEWTARKLGALLDAAPDCIVVVNREGRIILVNVQLERQFAYCREELLGIPMEILIPKRFRGERLGQWGDFFARSRLRPKGLGLELYARRKDGTEFPVDIQMTPLEIDGEMLLLGTIRDVTSRKRIEEALRLREERFRVAQIGSA